MTRAVWDLTSHNNTSQRSNRLWHRVVTKGSGDLGKWWLWEVVRKGGGDERKWWQRECGDFGTWWRRECGDFGKWWLREVVTKGSGEEGKWWRWEVVTLGSGDFVMAAWMLHGLCFGEEAGARNCVFFPCRVAAAGDERYLLCAAGAAGVVLVSPLCSAMSGCSGVRSSLRFLNLWLQIALEWLHDCCHALLLCAK